MMISGRRDQSAGKCGRKMELVTFCRWFTVRGKLHYTLPGIAALDEPF